MRLVLIALFLSCIDFAMAADPAAPTQLARVYRFNMEWGCYEGGSLQGRDRANLEATCGCFVAELDRTLSVDEWTRAAQASVKQDEKGESEIMGPHFKQASETCQQNAGTPAATAKLPELTGTWRWARRGSQCEEAFEYRADGTARVVSGKEVTKSTYKVEDTTETRARYKLSMSITDDNNEVDCAGSVEDATGASIESYIFVSDTAGAMVACRGPTGQDCIGPLFRMSE